MGLAEIHFHLLAGIDDGPSTVEESLELARMAARDRTETIVTTPHVSPGFVTDVSVIPQQVLELAERLHRERISVRILGGGELAAEMVGRLSQRELETIAQGPVGRRWLLLEAPLDGLDEAFTAAADELRDRGFSVVVAHPERSVAVAGANWLALEHELRAGSALQLTAGSLLGAYGDQVRRHSLRLLRLSRRVAIASDAHGPHRPPSLGRALLALSAMGHPNPARPVAVMPRVLVERGLQPVPALVA